MRYLSELADKIPWENLTSTGIIIIVSILILVTIVKTYIKYKKNASNKHEETERKNSKGKTKISDVIIDKSSNIENAKIGNIRNIENAKTQVKLGKYVKAKNSKIGNIND